MKKIPLWLLIVLIFCLACGACSKDEKNKSDEPSVDDDQTADDDQVDDDVVDDDTADDDVSPPPQVIKYKGDFDFEVQFKASFTMEKALDHTLTGTLTPSAGFDVISAEVPLEGTGKLYEFPEALGRLIALKMQGPAVPGGKCGDQPVSYSLTLTYKEDNGYVVGGLTAYCGENTYIGRAARLMRLSGLLLQDNK